MAEDSQGWKFVFTLRSVLSTGGFGSRRQGPVSRVGMGGGGGLGVDITSDLEKDMTTIGLESR